MPVYEFYQIGDAMLQIRDLVLKLLSCREVCWVVSRQMEVVHTISQVFYHGVDLSEFFSEAVDIHLKPLRPKSRRLLYTLRELL